MGSNPITHPIFLLGCSQVVRHETLTLAFRRSESCHGDSYEFFSLIIHQICEDKMNSFFNKTVIYYIIFSLSAYLNS